MTKKLEVTSHLDRLSLRGMGRVMFTLLAAMLQVCVEHD